MSTIPNVLDLLHQSHTSDVSTTGEDPFGYYRRLTGRVAAHAAMIALAAEAFNCPIGQAISSFAERSPERGNSPNPLTLADIVISTSLSPSPGPLPIPPRTNTPDSLAYMPRTPTPEPPPTYVRAPDYEEAPTTFQLELGGHIEAVHIGEEEERQTPMPEGQQPGVNPGTGWILNSRDTGPCPNFIIPDGSGGEQIAPYIQYDMQPGCPEVLATRGRNCTVHSTPLRAKPKSYDRPFPTRKQQFTFTDMEAFSPIVDQALRKEDDISLTAEVQRYRFQNHYANRLADRISRLKLDLADARWEIRDSARALAKADAYERVMARVHRRHEVPGLNDAEVRVACKQLRDNRFDASLPSGAPCGWCYRQTHNLEECSMLKKCQLCTRWGHDEYQCHHPHHQCMLGEVCRVAPDHGRYSQPCRAVRPDVWA
jgi:hypothetical protein